MAITATYEFEELIPVLDGHVVEGMMLYGTATLESAEESEPHSFYVTKVVLSGGLTLRPSMVPNGHVDHRAWLFKAIANILESDRTAHGQAAQMAFDEELEGSGNYEPDYRSQMRRERRAHYA